QPFGRVSARIVLDEPLIAAFNGNASCYVGEFGSSEPCPLTTDEASITTEVTNLTGGENVSIALGFAPGTFAPAPEPIVPPAAPKHFLQEVPLLIYGGLASLVAAIGVFIGGLVRGRAPKTGRAIIAQYEPPAGLSVAEAAELLRVRDR